MNWYAIDTKVRSGGRGRVPQQPNSPQLSRTLPHTLTHSFPLSRCGETYRAAEIGDLNPQPSTLSHTLSHTLTHSFLLSRPGQTYRGSRNERHGRTRSNALVQTDC